MSDIPGAPIHVRVRMVRESRGLSLTKLAQISGVARSTIHDIERGNNSPTYDTILKLCAGLDVRPAQLTDGLYPGEVDGGAVTVGKCPRCGEHVGVRLT